MHENENEIDVDETPVSGFNIEHPEDDSYGAFCLWECDTSPFDRRSGCRVHNGRPSNEQAAFIAASQDQLQ
jgi:hypothetical protein